MITNGPYYEFQRTNDNGVWSLKREDVLENVVEAVKGVKSQFIRYLEIGSFEGASTVWMMMHLPDGSTIDCIDIYQQPQWLNNVLVTESSITPNMLVGDSRELAPRLQGLGEYDIIYVDGDHANPTVMIDLVNAYSLVSAKGLVVVDDYHEKWPDVVKAVDSCVECGLYEKMYENYGVILRPCKSP